MQRRKRNNAGPRRLQVAREIAGHDKTGSWSAALRSPASHDRLLRSELGRPVRADRRCWRKESEQFSLLTLAFCGCPEIGAEQMTANWVSSRFLMLALFVAGSTAWAGASAPVHALASLAPRAPANATPVPPVAVREAQRCIKIYQPCGRGPFQCCPGLQCLPISSSGTLCGPPPGR
jgi:hypothetical protein